MDSGAQEARSRLSPDCTRIRVLAIYKRRSATNSLLFLEKVIEEFPFPIPTNTNRSRSRILCLRFPGEAQVSSVEAGFTALQRQGRAVATYRSRGVLCDRGSSAKDRRSG
jgi:hypothetical protein